MTKAERQKEMERYWRSEEWVKMKVDLLIMADHKCERCGKQVKTFAPHHLTYENFKNETYEDMQLLCMHCHEVVHGLVKDKRTKKRSYHHITPIESFIRAKRNSKRKKMSIDFSKGFTLDVGNKMRDAVEGIIGSKLEKSQINKILSMADRDIRKAWKLIQRHHSPGSPRLREANTIMVNEP